VAAVSVLIIACPCALDLATPISIVALQGFLDNDILQLGASLERASEHPLAAAIIKGAEQRSLTLAEVKDFQSVSGKDIIGLVTGC